MLPCWKDGCLRYADSEPPLMLLLVSGWRLSAAAQRTDDLCISKPAVISRNEADVLSGAGDQKH